MDNLACEDLKLVSEEVVENPTIQKDVLECNVKTTEVVGDIILKPANNSLKITEEVGHTDRVAKYPVISIPNGAKFGRDPRKAAMQMHRLKAEGLEPGIPDLHFPTASCGFHGLWLETKSAKGKPTEEQIEWLERLRELGHLSFWYRDDEEAFELVRLYHQRFEDFIDDLVVKSRIHGDRLLLVMREEV